jgi:hypothetical protein
MPDKPTAQEPRQGEYRQDDPNKDDHEDEINMIFGGSMSIALKTQGKKLEREISLAQRIKPGRRMKWSHTDISFEPEDHLEMELSNRNLPFMVKLLIRQHKVAKTLVDNGASLNLIIRKMLIEMGLNLSDLTQYMSRSMELSQDSRPLPSDASTSIYPVDQEITSA